VEAIVGFVNEGASAHDLAPAILQKSPAFLRFLSRVIYQDIGVVEGIRAQAARQGSSDVYLLGARTPDPDGSVAPEDMIGVVKVEATPVAAGSYQRNPRHRLLTTNGFFRLPDELERALDQKLRARCTESRHGR
jgi:hypothetical protein